MFKYNEKEKGNLFYNKLMQFNKFLIIPIVLSSLMANENIDINQENLIFDNNISNNILLTQNIDVKEDFDAFPSKFSKEDIIKYEVDIAELKKIIKLNNLFDKNKDSKEFNDLRKELFWSFENKMIQKNQFVSFEDRFKIINVLILLDEKEQDFFNKNKNKMSFDKKINDVLDDKQEVSYDLESIDDNFKKEMEYLTFYPIDISTAKNNLEIEKIKKLNSLEKILNFENINDIIYEDEILSIAFEYMKEYQYFLDKDEMTLESSR